jgi:hypothetical protein
MRQLLGHRPSGSLVVAITALVVALSGTALGVSRLVNGDTLIKQHSLSGNRLRDHTLTGKQINLRKLGKVPNASQADNATNATNATNAANATHAGDADTLAGQAASAFQLASTTHPFDVSMHVGDPDVSVKQLDTLSISARCTGTTASPVAQLLFSNSQGNATLNSAAGVNNSVGTTPIAFFEAHGAGGGGLGHAYADSIFTAPDATSLHVTASLLATGDSTTTGPNGPCFFAGIAQAIGG